MFSVCKEFSFDAAHNLPNYLGKCYHLHGHGFRLCIEVSGAIQTIGSSCGMIIDFAEMKEIVNGLIINDLDHSNLNDRIPNPTAENLIHWIQARLTPAFEERNMRLTRLRLYETPTSCAEWRDDK